MVIFYLRKSLSQLAYLDRINLGDKVQRWDTYSPKLVMWQQCDLDYAIAKDTGDDGSYGVAEVLQ